MMTVNVLTDDLEILESIRIHPDDFQRFADMMAGCGYSVVEIANERES